MHADVGNESGAVVDKLYCSSIFFCTGLANIYRDAWMEE